MRTSLRLGHAPSTSFRNSDQPLGISLQIFVQWTNSPSPTNYRCRSSSMSSRKRLSQRCLKPLNSYLVIRRCFWTLTLNSANPLLPRLASSQQQMCCTIQRTECFIFRHLSRSYHIVSKTDYCSGSTIVYFMRQQSNSSFAFCLSYSCSVRCTTGRWTPVSATYS